jgi:acetoin utilization deacetylase AcuC-like enzyme
MVRVYYDPIFLEHDPGHHPEHPGRLTACWDRLSRSPVLATCEILPSREAEISSITAVHEPAVVERARRTCQIGGYLDADTPVHARSLDVALRAAGTAIQAVEDVLAGRAGSAFCLLRPPGHHATRSSSMGFCLFNNLAVAAQHAIDHLKLERILIVDWDVHHGNGTQDIFYEDPRVFFLSSHRYPFYPGTGGAGETGSGSGLGTTLNIPLDANLSAAEILGRFERGLLEAARRCRPELVLLSAGFDAHWQDPIGGLRLDEEGFRSMARSVLGVAKEYSAGRLVSLLEGGYNVNVLARCVEEHLVELAADDPTSGADSQVNPGPVRPPRSAFSG